MNFKKEIAPLPEGFADAISKTISKLQHMQEAPASRKADRADGDTKPQDISGEEEKVTADKKAPARKGDKSQGEAMASVKEETEELEEVRNIKIAKDGKGEKMVNKQELKTYLQMGWKEVKEEVELDEAGCISSSYKKEKKEEIDPVNPKAVKKKFDDRKDKDIDNDGDEDESDEYLHKRRKAISKALAKDESVKKPSASVEESAELEGLDEGNMASAAKELETYARKNGGIDKGDFMKAAVMMKKGQKPQLMKFVDNLDTEPREKILSVMKSHMKEEVELDEARKSDYTIYHKTFSSAVQHAIAVAKKQGYIVDEDDWDRKVAMGPRKPGKGKTNSYHIDLTKNGKPTKQKLHMQVYYDQGRYELNMYIS